MPKISDQSQFSKIHLLDVELWNYLIRKGKPEHTFSGDAPWAITNRCRGMQTIYHGAPSQIADVDRIHE